MDGSAFKGIEKAFKGMIVAIGCLLASLTCLIPLAIYGVYKFFTQ